jgi:hypothetical protein
MATYGYVSMETTPVRVVATSEDGGRLCCQFSHLIVAFPKQLVNCLTHPTVHMHAAIQCDGPRWQHAVVSQRVSW